MSKFKHWRKLAIGLGVLIVLAAALVSLMVTTWAPSMRRTHALKLYSDYMTLYTADMTAGWDGDPAYFSDYLVDPAWQAQAIMHDQLYRGGGSVTPVGTPYFAVTKWAPLDDPVGHPDATVGLTVCYVQGNLVVVKSSLPEFSTSTGPEPIGHAIQVFFKYSKGRGDNPQVRLRIYDFTDITPDDGTCPLN